MDTSSTKLNRFIKGIRFRLTLVYSTLFGLFICIFALIISEQFLDSNREKFDSALLNYAIDVAAGIKFDAGKTSFNSKLQLNPGESRKRFPFLLRNTFYMVRSINGAVRMKGAKEFPDIPYDPELPLKEDYTHRLHNMRVGENNYRAINLKMTNREGEAYILQVATPSAIIEEQEKSNFLINSITIPLIIFISSFASYVVAGNALTPIKNLTATAKTIAATNLSQRVPVNDSTDEVGELSRTFNNLLERLEKSFKAQENFVANASHQLNTPLSIIKGELDVLESKARSPDEIIKFHRSLREELGRLIELVKNMLLISRVEAGMDTFTFSPIRMDEILLGVSARLRPKAREKRITKRFNVADELIESHDLEVRGEKQLLDSMFENILDNAIKYAPEDSTIRIDIKAPNGQLEVWFQDEGPGIDEEVLNKIRSHRFQRGSKSLIPGTGIGLSIAYQIADFHNAKIIYKRLWPQGSLFIIQFPK